MQQNWSEDHSVKGFLAAAAAAKFAVATELAVIVEGSASGMCAAANGRCPSGAAEARHQPLHPKA